MAAAVGNNGIGVAGVSHTAGIVPVRVSNSSGGGASVSALANCILYGSGETVANRTLPHASTAINVSYSTYSNGQIFSAILTAATTATNNGSVVVIAAGNENTNPVGDADPEQILYVASINESGTKSSFSNYGPYIDIAAPGENVVSTYVEVSCRIFFGCSISRDHLYAYWSGTSFAAPMVAGAALLVQAGSTESLTPAQIKARLTGGACEAGDALFYGSGVLNNHAAVHGVACGEASEPGDPDPDPVLVSVDVTPSGASIDAGQTVQFTATAIYDDDSTANVTAAASWNSTNTAIATIDGSGLATGESEGTAEITASFDGATSTAVTLTVNAAAPPPPVTLESITVSPAIASIDVDGTQQFTATGHYSDGTTANLASEVDWTSSNVGRATIDSGGLATGVSSGDVTITASLGGVSGTAELTVNEPAPPPGDDEVQVTLTGLPSDNNGSTWTARVRITATAGSSAVQGVSVQGQWSNGASGSASCTTDSSGYCDVALSGIAKRIGSVTFTVTAIDGVTPEGQLSVTVSKP